jgi:Tol biopolymer transport system component
VYVRAYADVNIWRVTTPSPGAPASSPPAVAIASNRRDAIPHISPDGRRVTFTSTRSGEHEIWAADVTGANAVMLTSMAANPGWPRWSPDGRQIAFHSNPEGNGAVFIVPSEGGKGRNLTSDPSTTNAFASFSRDGQWVYFTSNRTGQRDMVWKVPVGGGAPVQVSPGFGMMGIESPDGRHVYYVETESANTPSTLWRIPVAGGAPEKIVEGVFASMYDVLDGGIYHVQRGAKGNSLQYFDLKTRTSTTVADNIGPVDFGLSAARDGRTIMFTRVDSSLNDVMLVENFR